MMPMPTIDDASTHTGGRLVTTDGRTLPLERTSLEVVARGGIARTILRQHFVNSYDEPLQVSYQVPLPADAAVSGYAFQLGDRRIVGEVDKKSKARERYEEALIEGKTAALLEQDRSSLFSQDLGNVPPRASIVAELTIDQKLRWLPEGRWEWRFPTVAAPRYLGGKVPDAERITVDVADRPLTPRAMLHLEVSDSMSDDARPDSPTHALVVERRAASTIVRLADDAHLDRDIAVAWPGARAAASAQLTVARSDTGAYGLLTLTPPAELEPDVELARDLVMLIDTSGSMHGEPLDQAKRVCLALVDSLNERDSLSLIEFSMQARSWQTQPVRATAEARASARVWLRDLAAGGGTEMMTGMLAALEPLRPDAQRQVVVVSDGLIGFEHEVVGAIVNKLPRPSRVHFVGVGSAVNRSLTAAAARAGRGYEAIVGIGEDAERIAQRLVARTRAPVVVDVVIEGSALVAHAPARLVDLFAGAPALASLELLPEGGELVVRGKTARGAWEERLVVPPIDAGPAAVIALYGREVVEDLEMRIASGEPELDQQIEALGLRFQIATRLTSWVAISETPTVDPTAPTRRERMPHQLPHGMSAAGLGLRSAAPMQGMVLSTSLGGVYAAPMAPGRMSPPPPMAMAPDGARSRYAADEKEEAPRTMVRTTQVRRASIPRPGPIAEPQFALFARLLLIRPDTMVIAIALHADMLWSPSDITVELDDGTTVEATVIEDKSTRFGELNAGKMVRLALRFSHPTAATPQRVRLTSGRELVFHIR